VVKDEIPPELVDLATSKRTELLETLAEVDDQFGEIILNDETPTTQQIVDTIRRATIGLKFSPVFLGSAIKNTGVQTLLDGVCAYLPDPSESRVEAHDQNLIAQIKKEEQEAKKKAEEEGEEATASAEGQEEGKKQEKLGMVELVPAADAPLVALAFKLEEGRFGQLTYMRVYQGKLVMPTTLPFLSSR
jgi:elongation factor G